jgi:hypothetical protein
LKVPLGNPINSPEVAALHYWYVRDVRRQDVVVSTVDVMVAGELMVRDKVLIIVPFLLMREESYACIYVIRVLATVPMRHSMTEDSPE